MAGGESNNDDAREEVSSNFPASKPAIVRSTARFATRNGLASKSVKEMTDLPGRKQRSAGQVMVFDKIDKVCEVEATFYQSHPEKIGLVWRAIWKSENSTSAAKVKKVMMEGPFRYRDGDPLVWQVRIVDRELWVALMPADTDHMSEEQKRFALLFYESSKYTKQAKLVADKLRKELPDARPSARSIGASTSDR